MMSATRFKLFAWMCSVLIFNANAEVAFGQDLSIQPLPTNLTEALQQLQTLDRGPTRQRLLGPAEFGDEFPDNPLVSLQSCRAAADYAAKMDGRALVVIIDNKPGYERYEASWPRWKEHQLGNASECFAGVVAALAVQDGLLEFDEPVAKTITEWADDSKRSEITIRQLLTLTSGIEPGDADFTSTYKKAIQAKSINDPGSTFTYGSHAFQVFGELICRKLAAKNGKYVGMGYVNYLDERVFKPLQIDIGFWRKTEDDEADVALGAFLDAVGFAKFGVLLCNGGTWEGNELIKKELLQEVFKGTVANPQYGMGFWLMSQETDIEVSAETRMIMPSLGRTKIEGLYAAVGHGRQRLYLIPNEKVVIVRLSDPKIGLFRDETFFRNLVVERANL